MDLSIEMDNKLKVHKHLLDHNYVKPNKYINIVKKSKSNSNEIVAKQLLIDHNYILPNIFKAEKRIKDPLIDHSYCKLDLDYKTLRENNSDSNQNEDSTNIEMNNNETVKIKNKKVPDRQLKDITPSKRPGEALTYTILPGVRLNSQVFMDNLNHRYYKCSKRKKKIYLVCENKKNKAKFCPVLATISVDLSDNRIKTSGQHNHLPRKVDIPMVFFRRAIALEASKNELRSTSVRHLYDQEIARNPEGAKNYSILQSQMSIRKRRYRFRRQIKSENIQDTPNILNKDKSNKLCKLDNSNKFIKSEKLELSDNLDISQESNKPVKLKKSKKRVKSDKLINTSRALTLVNPLPLDNAPAQKDIKIEIEEPIDIKPEHLDTNYSRTIINKIQHSSKTFIDNLYYTYYKYSNNNNVVYLQCENHKKKISEFCPVTASINIGSNEKILKLSGLHNHLPLKNSILKIKEEEDLSIIDNFDHDHFPTTNI